MGGGNDVSIMDEVPATPAETRRNARLTLAELADRLGRTDELIPLYEALDIMPDQPDDM